MKKTSTRTQRSPRKAQTGAKKSTKGKNEPMLKEFFVAALKDIYWAEKHLTKALPKMAKAATTEELKEALMTHLDETKAQADKLVQVFEQLGMKAVAKKCEAMEGLVKEGEEVIEETEDGSYTRDVAIIMAAQKVEHYEIASYGGLVQLATVLGEAEAATLLEEILDEEKAADEKLTIIAESGINEEAFMEDEQ